LCRFIAARFFSSSRALSAKKALKPQTPFLLTPTYVLKCAVGTHEQLLSKRGLYFVLASKTQQAK
jgi:hypothetical protein